MTFWAKKAYPPPPTSYIKPAWSLKGRFKPHFRSCVGEHALNGKCPQNANSGYLQAFSFLQLSGNNIIRDDVAGKFRSYELYFIARNEPNSSTPPTSIHYDIIRQTHKATLRGKSGILSVNKENAIRNINVKFEPRVAVDGFCGYIVDNVAMKTVETLTIENATSSCLLSGDFSQLRTPYRRKESDRSKSRNLHANRKTTVSSWEIFTPTRKRPSQVGKPSRRQEYDHPQAGKPSRLSTDGIMQNYSDIFSYHII